MLQELSQFVRQSVNMTADEAEQRQYWNAISAATDYRSQIKPMLANKFVLIQYNRWTTLWNIKPNQFVLNNYQVTFNLAGSSLAR